MVGVTIPGLARFTGAISGSELIETEKSGESVAVRTGQIADLAIAAAAAATQEAVDALVGGAPEGLNRLSELAAAIGNDPAFAATIAAALALKVNSADNVTALALKAPLLSPTFTGTPLGPTAAPGTSTPQLATTAFVEAVRVILAAADALKAPLASPALTGVPTAPTATVGTNSTQISTTAFVANAIAALVASSPAALDTLNELAAALGNDPNFATTMTSALASKVATASLADPSVGAGMVWFLQYGSGSVGRTLQDKAQEVISAADKGADVTGVVDAAAAINLAISTAPANSEVLLKGTFKALSAITMRNGIRVVLRGTINAGSQTNVIDFTGVSDAEWSGGTINGDNTTNTQNGFKMTNASRNRVTGFKLAGCKNKGIDLIASSASGQVSRDNYIAPISITGCTSTSGAGISMFGNACEHNAVHSGYYTGNRIGITINGALRNTLFQPDASGNSDAGIMIDGIVTSSGDGGKYNKIIAPICNNNGPTASYGGIYLGNGSNYNDIIAPTCNGNSGAGLRISAGTGYEVVGNKFSNATLQGNLAGGAILSFAPGTQFTALDSSLNSGAPGLQLFTSDGCKVTNFKVSNQVSQPGIVIQSASCKLSAGEVTGNTTGINIGAGGSTVYTGNVVTSVDLTGNTTPATIANGAAKIINCAGVGTETFGSTSIKDGSVIAHSLYGTPQWASFDAADPTHVARVAAVNGANATLSLKDSAGNPVTVNETVRYNFKFNFGA